MLAGYMQNDYRYFHTMIWSWDRNMHIIIIISSSSLQRVD